jgi:hypothetical protein
VRPSQTSSLQIYLKIHPKPASTYLAWQAC